MPTRETLTQTYRKAVSTNSTATSFTAKTPTTTEPEVSAANGIHDVSAAVLGSDNLLVVPFGTDADNETFDMRVWGWSPGPSGKWIPILLIEVNVTLGNIAEGTASTFMADTVAKASGGDKVTPTGLSDEGAWFAIDLLGSKRIEFDFDLTGAASANAYFRYF